MAAKRFCWNRTRLYGFAAGVIILGALIPFLGAGCSTAGMDEWIGYPQTQAQSGQESLVAPVVTVDSTGQIVTTTPEKAASASSTYTGGGKTIRRTVTATRVLSPFGTAPGTVIGSTKPMEDSTGASAPVSVTPEGVNAGMSGKSGTSTGGVSVGILQRLWDGLKTWLFAGIGIVLVLGVGAVVLYFIPATTSIGAKILSYFPIVGKWIAGKVSALYKSSTVKVVQGIDDFKGSVAANPDLTAAQKTAILDQLKADLAGRQGDATPENQVVTEIRADKT